MDWLMWLIQVAAAWVGLITLLAKGHQRGWI